MTLDNPVGEKIEFLTYVSGLQTSNDLEAATKTISANTEPGSADYSSTLTLGTPADGRITVNSIAVRLQITVDSFGGGGQILNYRIKRGGASIGTGQIASGGSAGAKYAVHNVTTGTLTGDSALEVFLWVDQGSCIVSVCQLWLAVGNYNATWNGAKVLSIVHTGSATVILNTGRQGAGVFDTFVTPKDPNPTWSQIYVAHLATAGFQNATSNLPKTHISPGNLYLRLGNATVATDLPYVTEIGLLLRGES